VRINWQALLATEDVRRLVEAAIEEDVGGGDVTTEAIFTEPRPAIGRIVARTPTVVCGVPLAAAILARFDAASSVTAAVEEGDRAPAGSTVLEVQADVRAILTAERCILNFMMRLCGIANAARAAADAVPAGCRARVFDTRKTTPGWRRLEKAAVRAGGAENHRAGLFDAVLIKDNHLAAAPSLAEAVRRARNHAGEMLVEVEIDRLEQLDEAIGSGANIVLLDNFADDELRRAVEENAGRVQLEASGGVTLERIPAIARTGVDRISMGALTHTVLPADLSLELA
jgi:nicotinate-nucleotide pyrophosphorylase (carboxylating)